MHPCSSAKVSRFVFRRQQVTLPAKITALDPQSRIRGVAPDRDFGKPGWQMKS
jgi:hypothetical protein